MYVCACVVEGDGLSRKRQQGRHVRPRERNFKDELQEFYSRCQSPCNLAGQSLPLNVHAASAAEGRRMDRLVIGILRTREKQLGNLVWRVQHSLGHLHGKGCFSSLPILAGKEGQERERKGGSSGDEPMLNRRGRGLRALYCKKRSLSVWIGGNPSKRLLAARSFAGSEASEQGRDTRNLAWHQKKKTG